MSDNYTVKAVLSAVDKNFTSTFAKAEHVCDGLASKVKSGLGFGVLSGIGQQAFNSITNSVQGLVGEMNQSGKAWKTFEGNLNILGKSKKEIQSAKKSMQDYATQTIYSASDMASTYSQLAAVGTKNCGELVKGFGGLAAAAENPKQAMKTLSQHATQMAAKPMVQWMDFKLMLEQTPAGIAAVARAMGKTTDQLVKDVQNGTVSTEEFFDAIQKVGNSDGFQKLATNYKSVDEAMDGLKETVSNKLAPAFDAVSKIGIDAIQGIISKVESFNVDKMVSKINSLADNIEGGFEKAKKVIMGAWHSFENTGAVDNCKKAFESLSNAIGKVVNAVANCGIIQELGGFFGELVNQTALAVQMVSDFVSSLDPGAVEVFARAIEVLVAAYLGLKVINKVSNKIKGFNNTIKSLFGKPKENENPLESVNESKITQSTSAIKDALSGIGDIVKSLGESIKSVFEGLGSAIESFGTAISTAVQGIGTGLATAFKGLGSALAMVSPPTWLAIGAAALMVGSAFALVGSQGEGLSLILQGVSNVISSLLPVIQTVVSGIVSVVRTLPEIFISVGQAINIALQGVSDVIVSLGEAISNVVTSISDGMSTIVTSVGEAISGVLNSLAGIIDSIGNAALNAGKGFDKLANGLVKITNLNLLDMGASLAAVTTGLTGIGLASVGVSKAASGMSTLLNSINSISPSLANASAGFSSLSSVATSSLNSMTSVMTSTVGKVKTIGSQIGTNVCNGVRTGMSNLSSIARNSLNSMFNTLSSAQSRAYQCGVFIGQGLANGLRASEGQVRSAAASLASAADEAIRAKARIGSPSKVAAKNGNWIGQGLVIGLESMQSKVQKVAYDLFNFPQLETPRLAMAGTNANLSGDYEYYHEATFNFTIPFDIDGKEFAKATAEYTGEELEKKEKIDKYLKGVKR